MEIIKRIGSLCIVCLVLLSMMGMLSGCVEKSKELPVEEINDVSELNGKTIGCEEGASFLKYLQNRFPDSDIIENATQTDSIQALKSRRIDAYFTDEPMARQQVNAVRGLKIIGDPVTQDQYGFILNLRDTGLCNEINGVLDKYRKDGTMDSLKDKWIDGTNPKLEVKAPKIAQNGTLKVVLSPDSAPFAYMIGHEYVGYDVELMYMVANELGYGIQIDTNEFAGLINDVSFGTADLAIGCITYMPDRAENVLFTQGTYYSGAVAVVLKNQNHNVGFFADLKNNFENTFIREQRWMLITDGLLVTIYLSVMTLIFGSLLGFAFSFMLRSKNKIVSAIGNTISSVLDGIPLLIILMVLYYIIFAPTTLSAISIGIIGLSIDFANTVAGIIDTGIALVDKGQIEAAEAMGYSKWQIFTKILFPQATFNMFSQYTGSVMGMIKGTSILGYITVIDLARAGDLITGRTYEAFFPLIVTAIIYYIIIRIFLFLLGIVANGIDPKKRKRILKGI